VNGSRGSSQLFGRMKGNPLPVHDLTSRPEPFVSVAELAEYWLVDRKQIYKQIEEGTLPAIRFGPRLFRIRTTDAIEFERRANITRRSAVG
jgi:excisionase family DNA binding protein